jgi:transcriptional regulator with XRE-family HTH domain
MSRLSARIERSLAKTIGAVTLTARKRAALTQAEVARRVGVQLVAYGRIERGQMFPSVPTLRRLCEVLGIASDELLGLKGAVGSRRKADKSPALLRLESATHGLTDAQLRLLYRLAESFHPSAGE